MIKKFNFDKMQPSRRMPKFAQIFAFLGAFLIVGYLTILQLDNFFDQNTLVFNSPITIRFAPPIQIKKRTTSIKYIREFIKSLPTPKTPIEEYICQKFGSDCQLALAIAQAESGIKEEAIHINSDGSIDMGIFQINSVHWKKEGCNPKALMDAYKNVDCAYKIYKSSGWNAWTTYKLFLRK